MLRWCIDAPYHKNWKLKWCLFFPLFITVFIKALLETCKNILPWWEGGISPAQWENDLHLCTHFICWHFRVFLFFFSNSAQRGLLGRHVAVLACSQFSDQQKGWLRCLTGLRGFDGCFGAINDVGLNKTQSLFCFTNRNLCFFFIIIVPPSVKQWMWGFDKLKDSWPL